MSLPFSPSHVSLQHPSRASTRRHSHGILPIEHARTSWAVVSSRVPATDVPPASMWPMVSSASMGVRVRRSAVSTRAASSTEQINTSKKYEGGKVEKVPINRIRNFSIIAHIDHGKSTLADQLLIKTDTVASREMKEQFMDSLDLERERGITIKLNTARMKYKANDGETYALNLIDTPGHVDFSYEVSRSLAACEGCLLVVDASQGVEAQTLANVYLAIENNLEIIVVLNKIDLPGAEPERIKREIEEVIGLDCSKAILASAKAGIGIEEILEAVVSDIPPPTDSSDETPRALIFDSYYDAYRGVIAQFRVISGVIRSSDEVLFMNTNKSFNLTEIGVLSPGMTPMDELYAGEVGYLSASVKSVADCRVGDTITVTKNKAAEPLPGYAEAQPVVFCGLFPTDTNQYADLREALLKLQLNDAALKFEPEVSSAMGNGFRCGFLGLLHMDVCQTRLEREYDLDLIATAPTVVFKCVRTDGVEVIVDSPAKLPEAARRESVSEPYVRLEMIAPSEFNGTIMELAQGRRGEFKDMTYLTETRTSIVYDMPLAEVVTDYFDQLKSRTAGYASMEYTVTGYRKNQLVLLEVLINGDKVDPLAAIVHKDRAFSVGKNLVRKLKEVIPRQQFRIPIQATIGAKVIASESISALRKNVLAKCYGGDISRKKKLLKAQAKGKKRMKEFGKVSVPQEAFMSILTASGEDEE